MIERLIPSMRMRPVLRRSIEWFLIGYAVLMPVSLSLMGGVACVLHGCGAGQFLDALTYGLHELFTPTRPLWHLAHAALVAVTATLFARSLDTAHEREQALLKQKADRYHDAIEHIEFGFYRTTLDGRYLVANSKFVTMLGYDSLAELMQSPVSALYPSSAGRERFLAELREKGQVRQKNFLLVKKDGTPLAVTDDAHLVGNTIVGIIAPAETASAAWIIHTCAYCYMIRDGESLDRPWVKPADYFLDHMSRIKDPAQRYEFSHGICPSCVRKEFPSLDVGRGAAAAR